MSSSMHTRLLVALTAVGCAAGHSAPSSLPVPSTVAVREMTESDTDLGPVAIAAAGYYKRVATATRLGFTGVALDGLAQPRLTDEVSRKYGFAIRPAMVCRMLIQSAGGRNAPPPAITAGTPQDCTFAGGVGSTFGLTNFRRVADTAYVGGNTMEVQHGEPAASEVCMVLVRLDTAWVGVGKRGRNAKVCGR